MRSGASAADTVATTRRITEALGLRDCLVDVTLTALYLSHRSGPRSAPMTELRIIRGASVSYDRIQRVHGFLDDVEAGRVPLGSALRRLDDLDREGPLYPAWTETVAWAALSGFFTVILRGGWVVFVAACLAAAVVDRANRWLSARGVPVFHRAVLSGAAATAMATGLFLAGVTGQAALIVAGGIAVMLPGLAFTGGVQDAIEGYLVTAAARTFDAALVTAALVAGVGAVLYPAVRMGLRVPQVQPGGLDLGGWSQLPLQLAAAGMVCACLALCFQARASGLVTAFGSGALGWGLFLVLWQHLDVPMTIAAALASVVIGIYARLLDRFAGLPGPLTVVAGIAPMAPGYVIYQGMLHLSHGDTAPGVQAIGQAVTVGLALAAGVTFGQMTAGLGVRSKI
ncbi:threonine/serine exporter family protein [Actinocorallia longicatena]|uniref:Threonine/serine exporter family protein n=1 Tax=Actinocorallia longicatena TaxID=111803 RepID=A0ABP6PXS1_9ACTN